MATKVELQKFEDQAALRIKFASVLGEGPRLVSDASQEYEGFFEEPPEGWSVTEEGMIETISEYMRGAVRFSSTDGDVVMVEHETGLEILVMSVGLAESASRLISWSWKRWKKRRDASKPERDAGGYPAGNDTVVIERTTIQANGTRDQTRVTVPASLVTEELIMKYMTSTAG